MILKIFKKIFFSNIILMLADNIPCNARNPSPGFI